MDDLFEEPVPDFSVESHDNNDSPIANNEQEESAATIPPPPVSLQYCPSLDYAYDLVQNFARDNGFAIVKTRSVRDKKTGEVMMVDFCCMRSGQPRSISRGIRKTHSRRTNCPFHGKIQYLIREERWRLTIRCGTHNHGPIATSLIGVHRRQYLAKHEHRLRVMLDQRVPISDIIKVLNDEDGYSPKADPNIAAALRALAAKRTRAATACQTCRARKTRCDNARPVCGYCTENHIQCRYPDATPAPPQADRTSREVLQQLGHITSLLERQQQVRPSRPNYSPEHANPASESTEQKVPSNEHIDPKHLFASAPESLLRWPILTGMVTEADSCIRSFVFESQNYPALPIAGPPNDPPLKDDFLLPCLNYLSSANRRNPVVDGGTLTRYAAEVNKDGLAWNSKSCLVLLACALSHLSSHFPTHFPPDLTQHPQSVSFPPQPERQLAEAYFKEAQKRLGGMQSSLIDIQCLFLAASYEKHALRPLQSWMYVQQASSLLRIRLASQAGQPGGVDHHLEQRLYWSLTRAEREFQQDIPLWSTGLAECKYPDPFPDPPVGQDTPFVMTNRYDPLASHPVKLEEERSWFFYLAEISFRRIFDGILVLLYHDSPHGWSTGVTRLMKQCLDSDAQISLWFAHLPPPIHPIPSPTNDLAFFLEGRYNAAKEKIYRPLLYIALHNPNILDHVVPNGNNDLLSLAQKSVDICTWLIRHYWSHYRHGGIWFAGRGAFSSALIILAVVVVEKRKGPEQVRTVQPPSDWSELVGLSLNTLRKWEDEARDLRSMRILLEGVFDRVTRMNW